MVFRNTPRDRTAAETCPHAAEGGRLDPDVQLLSKPYTAESGHARKARDGEGDSYADQCRLDPSTSQDPPVSHDFKLASGAAPATFRLVHFQFVGRE